MAGEIFKLVGKIALDGAATVEKGLNGISDTVDKAEKKLQSAADQIKKTGENIQNAGEKMTVGATVPLAAFGTAAGLAASDLESSTARIQAALGLTEDEARNFSDIGQEVLKDGWGSNLDDVTDSIIGVKAQLGDIPDDQLQSITEKAIMLEQTFGMDMDESLRGVNALMSTYGMTAEEAFDYMTVGAQNGLDKTGELGDNLAEYATLFEENGYDAQGMFAILEAGLEGGAYNLDKVNDLVKEFGVRMSDGSVTGALDEMGGGWADLSNEIKSGSMTNEEAFQAVASKVSELGTEQEKATAISSVFGSMGEDAGIKVIEAMGGVNNKLEETSQAYSDVTGASDDALSAGETFANNWAGFMATVQEALAPVGAVVIELGSKILDKLVPAVEKAGEWFTSLDDKSKTLVVVIGGIVAAIGPLLVVLGTVVKAIGLVTGGFGAVSGLASTMATAVGGAMAAISAPVLIVVAAIAALAAGFVVAWNHSEEFRDKVTGAIEGLKSMVEPIFTQIKDFIVGAFQTVKDWWDSNGQLIMDAIGTAFNFLADIITVAMTVILDTVIPIVEGIIAAFQLFIDIALPIVQFFIDTILNIFTIFAGIIQGDWQAVWDAIVNIFNAFVGMIVGIFENLWNNELIQSIVTFVADAVASIGEFVSNVLSAIAGFVVDMVSKFAGMVADIIGAIAGFVADIVSKFAGMISDIIGAVAGFVADIISKFASMISDVIGAVAGFVSDIVSKFAGMISDVIGAVAGFVSDVIGKFVEVKDGLISKVTEIKDGIVNGFKEAVDRAKETFSKVKDALMTPIESARDLIKGIVDKIKGFFDFDFKLPSIKLPHFGIQPSGWSIGDLLKGSIPSLGIDWYANGGVFNSPSVIGVGEQKGVSEAVVPLRSDVYAQMGAGIVKALGNAGAAFGGSETQGDIAVSVNVLVDGEDIASVIEPTISEKQGQDANIESTRGGLRLG